MSSLPPGKEAHYLLGILLTPHPHPKTNLIVLKAKLIKCWSIIQCFQLIKHGLCILSDNHEDVDKVFWLWNDFDLDQNAALKYKH